MILLRSESVMGTTSPFMRTLVERRTTSLGAPLVKATRVAPSSGFSSWWMVDMRLRRLSNGSSRTRGMRRSTSLGSRPAFWALTRRHASVGSPSTV